MSYDFADLQTEKGSSPKFAFYIAKLILFSVIIYMDFVFCCFQTKSAEVFTDDSDSAPRAESSPDGYAPGRADRSPDTVYNEDALMEPDAPNPSDYYSDLCRMLDAYTEQGQPMHTEIVNYVQHDGAMQMFLRFIARYTEPFNEEPIEVQERRSMGVWKMICWWVINPPVPSPVSLSLMKSRSKVLA